MRVQMALFLCLGFLGCAGTGFVPMDKDTYMVAKKSMQIGFGPPLGSKAAVYQEANKFCAKQDKKVETVEFVMRNPRFASPGSVSLQFRCVSGADSDNNALEVKLKTLNKLLSDGMITQKEFDEQKQQLLDDYSGDKK